MQSNSSWKDTSIGEIATGIFDGPHATPKKTSEGPIFLGISSLTNGRLDLSDTNHINEEDFIKWTRRVTPREGDIVFSYETRLGEAARIPAGLRCCLGRRMALIRPDVNLVDSRFLLYLYLSPAFQETIRSRTVHGSTVDRIPLLELPTFPISLPPLPEQKAIAHILGTLDDKIELNRRMNETLESMARALFKSWFVDFDPVRAKMDGRQPPGLSPEVAALFPDKLVHVDGELIPEGWRKVTVGDVMEGLYDGPHATPAKSDEGPVFLGIKNLTGTKVDLSDVRHISEDDWPKWTKRIEPRHKDIVFTYEATLGYFAIIPPGLRCCLGRRLALIRPRLEDNNSHFMFHSFTSDPFLSFLETHSIHGATVNRVPLSEFPKYPLLWPSPELVAAFETTAQQIWNRIHVNDSESEALKNIRDSLLPRLLSGEVRAIEVEKFVGSK